MQRIDSHDCQSHNFRSVSIAVEAVVEVVKPLQTEAAHVSACCRGSNAWIGDHHVPYYNVYNNIGESSSGSKAAIKSFWNSEQNGRKEHVVPLLMLE